MSTQTGPARLEVDLRGIAANGGGPVVTFRAEGILLGPGQVIARADVLPAFDVMIRDEDGVEERIPVSNYKIIYAQGSNGDPGAPLYVLVNLSRESQHDHGARINRGALERLLENRDLLTALEELGFPGRASQDGKRNGKQPEQDLGQGRDQALPANEAANIICALTPLCDKGPDDPGREPPSDPAPSPDLSHQSRA